MSKIQRKKAAKAEPSRLLLDEFTGHVLPDALDHEHMEEYVRSEDRPDRAAYACRHSRSVVSWLDAVAPADTPIIPGVRRAGEHELLVYESHGAQGEVFLNSVVVARSRGDRARAATALGLDLCVGLAVHLFVRSGVPLDPYARGRIDSHLGRPRPNHWFPIKAPELRELLTEAVGHAARERVGFATGTLATILALSRAGSDTAGARVALQAFGEHHFVGMIRGCPPLDEGEPCVEVSDAEALELVRHAQTLVQVD